MHTNDFKENKIENVNFNFKGLSNETMKNIMNKSSEKREAETEKRENRKLHIRLSAIGFVICFAISFFFFQKKPFENKRTFNKFNKESEIPLHFLNNKDLSFFIAHKDWESVIDYLDAKSFNSGTLADQEKYFLGVAIIKDGKYIERGVNILEEVKQTNAKYYHDSRWFLALGYLACSRKKECYKILCYLIDTESEYKDKSLALIKKFK